MQPRLLVIAATVALCVAPQDFAVARLTGIVASVLSRAGAGDLSPAKMPPDVRTGDDFTCA